MEGGLEVLHYIQCKIRTNSLWHHAVTFHGFLGLSQNPLLLDGDSYCFHKGKQSQSVLSIISFCGIPTQCLEFYPLEPLSPATLRIKAFKVDSYVLSREGFRAVFPLAQR